MAPPKVEFKGKVVHLNTPVVAAKDHGLTVPQGITPDDVRTPDFVSIQRMLALVNDLPHISASGIAVVHGVVKSEFALVFPDPSKQWVKTVGPNKIVTWQFQGGEVLLQSTVKVHILDTDKPPADDKLKRKRFAIIWAHELLHVLDEIIVVRDWMPNEIKTDELIKKYLIDAAPIDEKTYDHYIAKDNLTPWLRNGFWAIEHNRRAAIRDSPAEYSKLSDEINEINTKIINRK